MSSRTIRVVIPLVILIISLVFITIQYFVKVTLIDTIANLISTYAVIVITMTLIPSAYMMGRYNARLAVQGKNVQERIIGLYFNIILVVTIALGLATGLGSKLFTDWYSTLAVTTTATFVGTTALYIFAAVYRAFRVRTFDGALMLIGVALVVLGNIPAMDLFAPIFITVRNWIMNVANPVGLSSVAVCAALGAVAFTVRVVLGKETGVTGAE